MVFGAVFHFKPCHPNSIVLLGRMQKQSSPEIVIEWVNLPTWVESPIKVR